MNWRRRAVGVGLVIAVTVAVTPQAWATDEPRAAVDPMANPVIRYAVEHPTDYIGIDRVARREFGVPVRFVLNGVDQELDAGAAQRVLDDRHGVRLALAAHRPAPRALPVNAFTVGFFWAPSKDGTALATGTWDFRDEFIGGGAPDDIATVGVQLNDCLQIGRTTVVARDYQGKVAGPNQSYVRDSGLNGSPVVGIRDQAKGFAQTTDHGAVTTVVEKKPGCGPTATGGQFIYEHNQDGGNILNVSVGFGFLSVGYSGGTNPLQKSAGPAGYKFP